MSPRWVEVSRVTAAEGLTSAEDGSAVGISRRFYRIVEAGAGQSEIVLLGSPELTGEGWRITWTAEPGSTYALERWTSDVLGTAGVPPWTEVARVTASGGEAFATDPGSSPTGQRFYRVTLVAGTGGDVEAPTVSAIEAAEVDGGQSLLLKVTALDNQGVESVIFLDGDVELGEGSATGEGFYEITVPYDPAREIKPYFVAKAVDATGNAGFSPVLRYGLEELNRFAVVDGSGNPTGEYVEPNPDGSLPPFEYRPGGRNALGATRELSVKFGDGARVVVVDGKEYIEFTEAEASFGEDSPMQFLPGLDGGLAALGISQGDGNRLTQQATTPKRLPLGQLTMEDLAVAFDHDPEVGIPVVFFERFAMMWTGGVLEDYGIRAPRFGFIGPDLPLPEESGDYPDYALNFLREREVRLAFYGEFTLPDQSLTPPTLRVPAEKPLWLTLSANGAVSVQGSGELIFPDGPRFKAEIRLDDPFYEVQIAAESLHVPLLGSLAELLPPDPNVCVPGSAADAELDLASDCLRAFARACVNFSASAQAAGPSESSSIPAAPPDEFSTLTSLLEAWIYSAVTPAAQSVPLTELRDLLRQIGQASAGSREIGSVLRFELALLRAREALENGAFVDSAEARAELEQAIEQAEAAARARAEEADAVRTLAELREVIGMLVKVSEIRQQLSLPEDDFFEVIVPALLNNFAGRYTSELGVETGSFAPENNPVIAGMNRFVVYEEISNLLGVLSDSAVLGFEEPLNAPIPEALSQLALRLYATSTAAMDEAEAGEDVPGFTYALADFLDLLAMRDLGIFPVHPALEIIPATTDAGVAAAGRLDTLLLLDLAKPRNERSFVHTADEIRRLLRILRTVPAGVTFASPPIERVYTFMEEALGASFTLLGNSSVTELVELLEGGTLHARLGRQFQFASGTPWETERLGAVTSQLATEARGQQAWSELHRGAEFLIEQADLIEEENAGTEAERLSLRLVYVQQAAVLLGAAREVAVSIWTEEASRRADSGLLLADLFLPGDIVVEHAAGSAWYNRNTSLFGGAFKGRVRLPKFDGSFEILQASFNSGGAFDLSCFGTVDLPGARLTVPARFPLRVGFNRADGAYFSGEGEVALDSGLSFAAHLILDDPLYGFGLEARGLRFHLANDLTLLRPTLEEGALGNLSHELRGAFIEYFSGMNSTLETLVGRTTDLPVIDFGAVGEPPEFEAPQVTLPFAQLNAWANAVLLEVERGANAAYGGTLGSVRESLEHLNDQAREARDTLDTEIRILENQLERTTVRRRSANAFKKGAEQAMLGDDAGIAEALDVAEEGLKEELVLHGQLLTPEVTQNPGRAFRHLTVLLNLTATGQMIDADLADLDGDGLANESDNCPTMPNVGQEDADNDGLGDGCDPDPNNPAIPEEGPCKEFWKSGANPLLQVQQLLECTRMNYFEALGLDSQSGAVTDSATFEAYSKEELEEVVLLLEQLEAVAQMAGIETPGLENALTEINRRRHELLLAAYNDPETNLQRQYELARQLHQTAEIAGTLGDTSIPLDSGAARAIDVVKGLSDDELEDLDVRARKRLKERRETLEKRVLRDLQGEFNADVDDLLDRGEPRPFIQDLGIFVAVLFEQRGEKDAVYLERVNSFIRRKLQRMRQRAIDPNFLNERLHEGLSMAETLVGMTDWALQHVSDDPQLFEDLEVTLENLTINFTTVAEAQKAWWLLGRYAEVLDEAFTAYGDRMTTAVKTSFDEAMAKTLGAANRITGAFADLLASVDLESVVFRLPGDLVVQRVFGSVLYNRETEVLSGSFGGRIEFPESKAFFEIKDATIATDGTFSINAETGGPLPFGTGINVNAAVVASGTIGGEFSFLGSGEMQVDSEGELQTFAVELSYSTESGVLGFNSTANDLNLRFTDDFVLYNAGLGFEISTVRPAGRLVISGGAGIAARQKPLPADVLPEHFYLNVLDAAVSAELDETGFEIALERGTLTLPEMFDTGTCEDLPIPTGPAVILTPDQPIFVRYNADPQSIEFGGSILFSDIGFEVPGIEGFKVAVCTAQLSFSNFTLPVLSNVFAAIEIPLPDGPAIVDIENGEWALDGFPTGTIALRNDVALMNQGGFALTVLGEENVLCPAPTALTISNNEGQPFFRFDGGLRFSVPATVLSDDAGGEIFAAFCSGVEFGFQQFPRLEVASIAIGLEGNSNFRLGGSGGLLITGAALQAQGIQNLFNQSEENPFVLTLSGGFQIPDGPGFELNNAQFTFIGEPLPLFSLGGASLSTGDTFEAAAGLPLTISEAGFSFKNQNLPLPDVLAPDNLVITISASLGLPPEQPVVSGQVQGLTVTLENGVPVVHVSGIGLGIQDFEIPPLSLTGQVFVGGLGPDEDIYFAGNVGGTLQGAGVTALLAFNLQGPLGCCFSVNAGPAGIPLGPTGFLFTGAQGGVSFLNTNGDPCEFSTFINVDDGTGRPVDSSDSAAAFSIQAARPPIGEMHVMTWEQLRAQQERQRLYDLAAQASTPAPQPAFTMAAAPQPGALEALAQEPPSFPCPTGDCPPETINILCQVHPDLDLYADRVIVKFTSLTESDLEEIGVTRDWFESSGLTTAPEIAAEVAGMLRQFVENITPRPDPNFTGPNGEPIGQQLNALLDEVLANVQLAFEGSLTAAIQSALGENRSVFDAILGAAYAGVRCPDATVKLTGTFSHASVSSFLSGTGGAVLSTTGSAGLVGTVNLFGIPVGFLDGFVNATDANGDPNPSMCGHVRFALGPLELGELKALNQCEGCMTGVLGAFAGLADCLSEELFAAIIPKVAPHLGGLNRADALNAMTDEEKLAFLAEWFSLPPIPGAPECFLGLVIDSLDSLNPEFTLCGAVQPKLFGFPLTGSAIEVAAAADKTSMAGQFAFSSSLLMGAYGALFPFGDQASFGFGVAWPNPDDLIIGALTGRFSSPAAVAQYVEEGFAYMLENATYTVGFELSPFGFKGFQSGARVIMPNLTDHPEISGWIPPEERAGDLPSRLELMLAAVENDVLANPLWKGTADDIQLAFLDGDPRRQAVQGLSFSKDYFPHGGIVGAARMGVPRAITDSPPTETIQMILDPAGDLFARLGAALEYVQEYILTSSEVGTLGFYVPAPNPPIFTDGQGDPLPPEELLAAILTFDPSLGISPEIYPIERAFLQGYMDGRLLGVPIARATVLGTPPTDTEEGRLLISTEIPEGSWMKDFVDSANMTFEVRQAPPLSIEQQFEQVAVSLEDVMNAGSAQERELFMGTFADHLAASMPKVSLDLAVNNLRIPTELEPILGLDGSTSVRFVAYSPRFDPDAEGENPLAQAQRLGGVAMQARLRFADIITIDNAELAVLAGLPNPVTGLPPLAGLFDVPQLPIPLTSLVLQNVQLAFNSEPSAGQPFLSGSGSVTPITIAPLLEIVPLQTTEATLGAALSFIRNSDDSIASSLRINPARLAMPAFAEGLSVEIHGAAETDPFTLSTEDPWAATVSLKGGLVLRDPAGVPVLRVGAPTQTFSAALSGDGLDSASMTVTLPTGIEVTAFPGLAVEQVFQIGNAGANAQLTISSEGAFELSGELAGTLALAGLPVEQINAGASIRLTESSLTFTGAMSGGDLDGVNLGSAEATLVVTKQGVSLNGSVSLVPLQLGIFRISGADGGDILAVLDNDGLRIESGARLALQGISEDLLVLQEFVIGSNGDFSAAVASGEVTIPNYFRLSEGSNRIERTAGVARFELVSPRMTVFPGTPHQTLLPAPLERLLIDSNGRFYYDSGTQTVALPHAFSAGGRLEFGWEPDANAPLLAVNSSPVQFGLIDTGTSASQTLTVRNDGGSQLLVGAASSDVQTFTVSPVLLPLAPGEESEFNIRFFATEPGTVNGSLTLTHNTATSPTTISLTGQGRAVPVYYQSADTLDFGDQPVGGGAIRQVIVANLGTAPLEIESVSVPAPFTGPTGGFTVDPGDFRRLLITFHSTAIGPANGTLTLVTTHDGAEHQVQLSGMGSQQRWWIQRDTGTSLRSIDQGFAVGDQGQLLSMNTVSQDGDRWTQLPSLGNIQLNRVYGNPNGFGNTYAVGRSGVVLRYESLRWTPIAHPVVANGGNQYLGVATYWPSHLLMLVGQGGRMVREHSFGAYSTVSSGTLEDLHDVAFNASASFGIAVGSDGTILRSIDQGASWTPVALPTGLSSINLTLRAVDINASGVAVIVGDNGTVLRSGANGLNWAKINVPTIRPLFDVRIIGSDAYAVGDDGVFLLSSNAALSWQIEGTRAGTGDLFGVYARDGKVWTVGQNGFIQHRPIDPPAGPILGFSTGLLEFGNLPLGATSQRTAWVYNRGTDTLEISSIQGNNLFSVAQTSMSIPPGEQRLLRVYFHPQAATDTDLGNPTRVIVFQTNDPDGVHYLGVRGTSQANAWRQMPSATDQHLREVQFTSSLIGYALFDDGIIKTVDGGASWTSLSVPSAGQFRALHFLTSTQGMVGGGDDNLPFILRTLNGGASWTSASLAFGIEGPVMDISVSAGEDSRGYAVTAAFTTGQLTKQGQVLRTLNAGSSWTIVPGTPDTFFDGAVAHSYSPFSVLVSSGGTLYRSADSGSSWETLFTLGGAFPIQSISSFGTQNTFVAGLNGLLRRSTSININPPVFTAPAIFASGAILDVHFVSQDHGWCAVGGASSGGISTIYGTIDGGLTWKEQFSITDGTINSVWGVSETLAFAVGTDGRVWKFEPFTSETAPIASMPALLDFGAFAIGESSQQTLQISNLGGAPLVLNGLTLDSVSAEAFEVAPLTQTTVASGESTTVTVSFAANQPGNYSAFLTLSAEGSQNSVVTELKASVETTPQLVVFASEPAGLEITIDDTTYTTPVAFAVVSGASAAGEWTPGSTHSISAPDQQTLGGIAYQFQGWNPARDAEFSLVASSSQSQTFTAQFVRNEHPLLAAAGVPASNASDFGQPLTAQATVTPPSDVPAGPWLKLSQASIQAPGLGGLNVQGAVFLSATGFSASLDSGAFRLPQDPGQPELLEITAGSWRLDFSTTPIARMLLVANSPGLQLFDQVASPPSELLLDFASNGHFTAAFATTDDTPLIPGVIVIGPGAVSLSADPFLSVDLNGNFKILQKPDGTWAVNQNLAFSASEGPFTHDFAPLPPTLLDLGFTAVETSAGSAIRLARDTTGAFSVSVSNLQLELFGQTFTSVSGLVSAQGLFSVQLAPPATPFAIGPMRLAPGGDSTFDWNLRTGQLAVHFAGGNLRASGVTGWPSEGVDFPAFTIDGAGDFERKIALPAFTFNGIDIASGGSLADNYLLFKRDDGVVSVKLRDARNLFGNNLKMALDVASSGAVSGSFSGDFGVNTVIFGRLEFGAISLNYNSAEPDYQFQGLFRQVQNDFGIFFGSAGGKFSHLNCTGPDLDDCETGLFELASP